MALHRHKRLPSQASPTARRRSGGQQGAVKRKDTVAGRAPKRRNVGARTRRGR